MKYFKLMYDYKNDKNYAYCNKGNIGGMNEYVTSCGKEITDWEEVIFEYNTDEGKILTDYLANLHRWLVVSSHFRNLTKTIIEKQVQYLPVKVVEKTTRAEIDSYCVANIINVVDALDLEQSKYDIFESNNEKYIFVEKYALRGSKIRDMHIFRLTDDTIPIFVSETLKNAIQSNNMVGFDFLEVYVS